MRRLMYEIYEKASKKVAFEAEVWGDFVEAG